MKCVALQRPMVNVSGAVKKYLFGALGAFLLGVGGCFAQPVIFNSTESAAPGDVIYVQGDAFTSSPKLYFYNVVGNESSLTTPPSGAVLLTNQTATSQVITAQSPQNVPLGLYAVWVKDSNGDYSAPVFINRARAMQFEYGEVSAGYTFRIFGRNLFLAGATPTVSFVNGSNSYAGTVVTSYANNSNVLQITAPSNLPTSGTFTVNVSNGYGHGSGNYDINAADQTIQGRAGGTDSFSLGVPWGADFSTIAANVINVVSSTNPHTGQPYGADSTGTNNSVNAIQQALYDAGDTHYYPNGATVYLPAGTFLISLTGENTTFYGTSNTSITQPTNTEFIIPSNVVLEGAGSGSGGTQINDASPITSSGASFIARTTNTSRSGALNFAYTQTTSFTGQLNPPAYNGGSYPYPTTEPEVTELFTSNLNLTFAHSSNGYCSDFNFAGGGTHDVLVQNCTIDYALFGEAGVSFVASYYNIRGNTLLHHGMAYRSRIEPGPITDLVFENNHCTRDGQWPPVAANGQITSGTATSGTTTTLVDSNASWTTNAYANDYIVINSGTGQNENEQIASNTSTTITLKKAWTYAPDSTSNFAIGTSVYYPYEQGGPEVGWAPYETVLSNTFDAVNLPLTYDNDGETINTQGQPEASDTGTVTGVTTTANSTTITDSTQAWVPQTLVGQTLSITWPGNEQNSGVVTSNTATTVTVGADWTTAASGSHYSVTRDAEDTGTVSSATSTTLTGTSDSGLGTAWPVSGIGLDGEDTGLIGEWVSIINGPGLGQMRQITKSTTNTVTINPAWTEIPTSASSYAITSPSSDRLMIKGNTFSDQPRGLSIYIGSHDCVFDNNTFTNTGETIYIRGDQRPLDGTVWSGRFNPSWNILVADNVMVDTRGTGSLEPNAATYGVGTFYTEPATQGSILGTENLGMEFRRNLLQSYLPNQVDGATGEDEGFAADLSWGAGDGNFTDPGFAGVLSSVFDDNVSINTDYPYTVSTGSYNTTIWDPLSYNGVATTNDVTLKGAGHGSTDTVVGTDPNYCTFDANFTGTGTSTGIGGTGSNMVDVGATGLLLQEGSNTASIYTASSFDSGSGACLRTVFTGSGTTAGIQFTPPTQRSAWQRIFDQRSGQWVVNGAFDYFVRPAQTFTNGAQFRPIDITSGLSSNLLRLVMNTNSPTILRLQIDAASGGGGNESITGTIPAMQANTVYHIGVTFATNVTTSAPPYTVTAKMYFQQGTGQMIENSTTLIATGTFTLNHSVINDTNPADWYNGGAWNFADGYNTSGLATTTDYDGLRFYYADPGTFPALDMAVP